MISANRYIAVLMLIGILLQINVVPASYGLYYLNRKAIAEKVCEKKVKNCCGQCFLQKKIAEVTDAPAAQAEKLPQSKTFEELLGTMPGILPVNVNIHAKIPAISSYCIPQHVFLLDGVKGTIDHPPKA
ncbi:MAG: hypothetical protein HGB36_02660 [Chlorobiaceae bacterium]|nr:hypothetical protein [Chlorobiaceae bacterium]